MERWNKIRNSLCLLGITFNVILFGLGWLLESRDLQLLSLFNMGAFSLGLLADHYNSNDNDKV
jgi:hypothetical protein